MAASWFGGYFIDLGPEWLASVVGSIYSELYQQILQENVRVSVHELKLKWVMQQNNYHKHTCKPTKKFLRAKEMERFKKSSPCK